MRNSKIPLHFDMEVDLEEDSTEIVENMVINSYSYLQSNTLSPTSSFKSVRFNENISLLLNALGVFITALTQLHFKYVKQHLKEDYEEYSFCFWRYFWSFVLNGIYMYKKQESITSFSQLKNNVWFWVRIIDQFFVFETVLFLISFFRVSTATCFVSMAPVVILIMSSAILGEKFYMRYLYGIFICFFGVMLIVTNEKKKKPIEDISSNTSSNEIDYKNLFFGTFWGIVQLTTVALHRVSSKMLVKEKVNENAQVMYPSIACCVLSLLCIVCLGKNFSYGFAFVVHCGVNALFWVIFVRLLVISLRGVDLIKTTAIGYLSVLTVFIFGAVFLGEKVFISDIIGSLLILGYNLFNTLYPVKE